MSCKSSGVMPSRLKSVLRGEENLEDGIHAGGA
jgi:hypothetical protein